MASFAKVSMTGLKSIFRSFGWDVVILKNGKLQKAAFEEPGGQALAAWISQCSNSLYSALVYQGGAAWRKRLQGDIGDQGSVTALLDRRTDRQLEELMSNLGGHCLETLIEAFQAIDHRRPVVFIAYTIKGWGTPLAGHKDNHAGLMTSEQMRLLQTGMDIPAGSEWEKHAGLKIDAQALDRFLAQVPFFAAGPRRFTDKKIASEGPQFLDDPLLSTQAGFGKILDRMAQNDQTLAARIVTTSPDVTVSTNLGPWVNRRGLFSRREIADTFRNERVASAQKWRFSPEGQHIELGIAEMNLFLLLGAAGLSHSLFGRRLLPVGTLYDPFVARGLDALNYACYMDARFMLIGTPSGVSLAPEGGAHQSIGTPLIGMAQDGIAAFEPAYLDELSIIMDWAFNYMQRDGDGDPDEHTWLRDETGGSVYLRLSTRALDQPQIRNSTEFSKSVIDGGYWQRQPGANAEVIIAYQGCIAPEAIEAAGLIGEDRRDIGVLAITSADRLNAGWHAAQRARKRGNTKARSHIERLLAHVPRDCLLITVIDGHPATLAWLGSVWGHRAVALGVEHFGQTGSLADLYNHFGIDAQSIVSAASNLTAGRPVRHFGLAIQEH